MTMEKIINHFREFLHVPGRSLTTDDGEIKLTKRAQSGLDYESILDREMLRWSRSEETVIHELQHTILQRIAEIDGMAFKGQRPTLIPIKEAYFSFQAWLNKRERKATKIGGYRYNIDQLETIAQKLVAAGFIKANQEKLFMIMLLNPEGKPCIKWLGSNPELLWLMTLIFKDEKKHVAFAKKIFLTTKPLNDNQLTKKNDGKGFPKIDDIFMDL